MGGYRSTAGRRSPKPLIQVRILVSPPMTEKTKKWGFIIPLVLLIFSASISAFLFYLEKRYHYPYSQIIPSVLAMTGLVGIWLVFGMFFCLKTIGKIGKKLFLLLLFALSTLIYLSVSYKIFPLRALELVADKKVYNKGDIIKVGIRNNSPFIFFRKGYPGCDGKVFHVIIKNEKQEFYQKDSRATCVALGKNSVLTIIAPFSSKKIEKIETTEEFYSKTICLFGPPFGKCAWSGPFYLNSGKYTLEERVEGKFLKKNIELK